MERKQFSIGEAVRWGFKTFFNQIIFFLVLGLTYIGLYIAWTLFFGAGISLVAQQLPENSPILYLLVVLLGMLISLGAFWLNLGLIKISFDIYDYGKAEIKTLFSQWHLIIPACLIAFLMSIVVAFGLAFFIIPGIYFLCRFIFSMHVLIDKQQIGILETFQESSHLTQGARWRILGLLCVSLLICLLPFLAPVSILALVYAYRKQQENALQLPVVM